MATGLDDLGVFCSDPLGGPNVPAGAGGDYTQMKTRFREFLREYRTTDGSFIYRDDIKRAVDTNTNFIVVNLGHMTGKTSLFGLGTHCFLLGFDPSLAETMTKRPSQAFEMLEEAAKLVADELTRPRQDNEPIDDDFQVQLISGAEPRSIRELSALDVGKLVKIPGIAVSSSQVKAKVRFSSLISISLLSFLQASILSLRCRSCQHTKSNIRIKPGLEGYVLPRKCEAEASASRDPCPLDPYILVPELCKCRDFQNVKMQESPDSIPTGKTPKNTSFINIFLAEMPRHVGLYMERELVDRVVPGNRIEITGIYQIRRQQVQGPRGRDKKTAGGVGIRQSYIRVLGVEVESNGPGRAGSDRNRFTEEEVDIILLLVRV